MTFYDVQNIETGEKKEDLTAAQAAEYCGIISKRVAQYASRGDFCKKKYKITYANNVKLNYRKIILKGTLAEWDETRIKIRKLLGYA